MSDMKTIFENLRNALNEEGEEQLPAEKAKIMAQAENEVDAIVSRIKTTTRGDENLANEVIQSIIAGLTEKLEMP
jgi:hypothetical protein